MIDFRHETFLHLCKIKNYTKTARELHMTQPAVTQQIQFLEEHYGCKLFNYSGKTLIITKKGQQLFEYTMRMMADSNRIRTEIMSNDKKQTLTFGATLSIGEYIMPGILSKVMGSMNDIQLNMLVENTQSLLTKLQDGTINFALLEGFFDKSKYGYKLFSFEEFIGVCSPNSKFREGVYSLNELLPNRLILRESGSGTRDILEQILLERNLSKQSFDSIIEVGNMSTIKELVKDNHGISFMYKVAAQKEILNGTLFKINIKDFKVLREFNFLYLKDSVFEDQFLQWLDILLSFHN
jgi:LysR family transcriptional regulator, transcriptional activator of the cysJI operon